MRHRPENCGQPVEFQIALGDILRERDDQDNFANFRGLDADADIQPALGAARPFDAKEKSDGEQRHNARIQPRAQAAQQGDNRWRQ